MTVLCALARCTPPGRHAPGCGDERCRGCQRATAADGLRLCRHHRDQLGTDAEQAAGLYDELTLALVAGGSAVGEHASRTVDHGLVINEHAADQRATIRTTLATWCRLISEDRGIALPARDDVHDMARYLAGQSDWLAASDYADEVADELHELAHGAPWRAAYPTGARVVPVGACPGRCTGSSEAETACADVHDGGRCPGSVRAILRRTDALLPSELVCDHRGDHRWTADQWHLFGKIRTYTAREIAATWRRPVGTVHRLASIHGWRRIGDGRRPELYAADDVEATMKGLVNA